VIRLAIFDCDGTLVDSQASICAAMDDCFAAAGLPPPNPERTRRAVGLSLPQVMARLLPDEAPARHLLLAEAYKASFQRMRAARDVEEPLYDGIPELLDALDADGWLLGVATGKSDRGLRLCLERHGLAGRFVTLQTADRHPSKPHPAMILAALAESGADAELCMMIGDTSYDMAMAKAAGVAAVGAGWGYHAPRELAAAGAHCIAHRPLDILDLVKAPA
jgi:phosphoglycolate phosphatase